jgi:CBS domain-containing protein
MKVRDIALKEVHCASPEASLDTIATMMRIHGVGALPICEDKRLVGIITDRDIAISCDRLDYGLKECKAREFMKENPRTASPDMDLEEAANIMAEEQVRRLPVIEDGKLVGMLSLGDISLALRGNDRVVAETLRQISTPTGSKTPK